MSLPFITGIAIILIIAAIAISQRSGPRVTRIETRREKRDEDKEDGQ